MRITNTLSPENGTDTSRHVPTITPGLRPRASVLHCNE
jgi:hypothetical protein